MDFEQMDREELRQFLCDNIEGNDSDTISTTLYNVLSLNDLRTVCKEYAKRICLMRGATL